MTIPHKEAALALADEATDAARAIGAANTLTFDERRDRRRQHRRARVSSPRSPRRPRAARALVLGAGGSARAVVWALREAGAAEVRVWNRTAANAQRLAAELGIAVEAAAAAGLLVNCTPVGLATMRPRTTVQELAAGGR